MDSVEYSGVRQFLLRHHSREARVHRELWECNDSTYAAYRKYLNHVREFGFPDEQDLSSPSMAVIIRRKTSNEAIMGKGSGSKRLPAVFSFSGVKHVIDDCRSAISVLRYGHLSSTILAFGSSDGNVWISRLGLETNTTKLEGGHSRAVKDLDWSLDNSLLLTCSVEGTVCLWHVDTGKCTRKFIACDPTNCARFHGLNQNIVVVGSCRDVLLFNCSTGAKVLGHSVVSANDGGVLTTMQCGNTHLFVGDSRGTVYTLKFELKGGVFQSLSLAYYVMHPNTKDCPVAGMDFIQYSVLAKGAALLITFMDSTVAVYKLQHGTSLWLGLMLKANMPKAARRIRAVWCPPAAIDEPEHVALGGEDTNVHIYDLARFKGEPVAVNELQAHGAPVVDVCWSYDESGLASADCDGTVIVWKRNDSPDSSRRSSRG